MKTIKTYIPVIVFILFLAGTGILKAQPDNHQDSYFNSLFLSEQEEEVAPLPFNTAAIASRALFQKIEKAYSSREEKVAPLPFNVEKLARKYRLVKAWKLASVQQEEPEINDLPPAVKKFMAMYRQKLVAQSENK